MENGGRLKKKIKEVVSEDVTRVCEVDEVMVRDREG